MKKEDNEYSFYVGSTCCSAYVVGLIGVLTQFIPYTYGAPFISTTTSKKTMYKRQYGTESMIVHTNSQLQSIAWTPSNTNYNGVVAI